MNLLKARRFLDQADVPLDTDLVYLTDFIPNSKLQIKGIFDKDEIDRTAISVLASNSNIDFTTPTNSSNKLRLIFMNTLAIVGNNNIYSSKDL
jgi:hypothetical protein